MAFDGEGDGAANNGFGRRSLHQWEGRLLYMAGYPVPPDTRPPGGWRLSAGGVPIPPPPQGDTLDVAIEEVRDTMTDAQRADPRYYPDNYAAWSAYFQRRYERELASYDGHPPPARNNAAGRRRWWSAPGRTLEAVLAHIEGGNFPVLQMPPPQPRPSDSRRRAPAARAPLVDLVDSDDDWYKPSPSPPRFGCQGRWGDPGQGSSSQPQAPPQFDDDDNDGTGDYTVFYRHFGM